MKNTHNADINEIVLSVKMVDGDWERVVNAAEVQEQYEKRARQLDRDKVEMEIERAEVMSLLARGWAVKYGYGMEIDQTWWTARPGALAEAVGYEVASDTNPTDVLCHFDGEGFLGISAKSTKNNKEISFKTRNVGSLDLILGTDLKDVLSDFVSAAVRDLDVSPVAARRKPVIRASERLKAAIYERGNQCMDVTRDRLIQKYKTLSVDEMRRHLYSTWLDSKLLDPYYIKVTGHKSKEPYAASIVAPDKNRKINQLESCKEITFHKLGDNSIGVAADNMRIMKMRAKFESQPLATSLRFIGEDW